jgi:hypothetical protein
MLWSYGRLGLIGKRVSLPFGKESIIPPVTQGWFVLLFLRGTKQPLIFLKILNLKKIALSLVDGVLILFCIAGGDVMTTEINDAETILTLSLIIADMASLIEDKTLQNNIRNLSNQLVCNASEKPLTNDFYNTMYNLIILLQQQRRVI